VTSAGGETMAADDYIARLAVALSGERVAGLDPGEGPTRLRSDEGGAGLRAGEEDEVLELARMVAHATERKNAPLACYLVGMHVAAAVAKGKERELALQRALSIARSLLQP
jgi:hypothetical protein